MVQLAFASKYTSVDYAVFPVMEPFPPGVAPPTLLPSAVAPPQEPTLACLSRCESPPTLLESGVIVLNLRPGTGAEPTECRASRRVCSAPVTRLERLSRRIGLQSPGGASGANSRYRTVPLSESELEISPPVRMGEASTSNGAACCWYVPDATEPDAEAGLLPTDRELGARKCL